jgi:hypothetical protein
VQRDSPFPVLFLAMACSAQEGLSIYSKGKQNWLAGEAERI